MNQHTYIAATSVHPVEATAQRILRISGIALLASVIVALGAVHLLAWRGAIEIVVEKIQ